jgi:hypothetical protein
MVLQTAFYQQTPIPERSYCLIGIHPKIQEESAF